MQFDDQLTVAASIARRDFAWDDMTVFDRYQDYDTNREDDIEALCDSAKLALCIALAEWLVAAFKDHDTTGEAKATVTAFWTIFSDTHMPTYWEIDDDDWRGPYRGILGMVITLLNDAVFCLHESPVVGMRTDWMLMYCQIVFEQRDPFAAWLETAFVALKALGPGRPAAKWNDPEDPRSIFELPISRDYFGGFGRHDAQHEVRRIQAFIAHHIPGNEFVEEL